MSHESARPCGCDPGAKYQCEQHRSELAETMLKALEKPVVRKTYPIASGCLDYFPLALLEVAHVSYVGNEQHNPGEPLHWDRAKSTDEADALLRHLAVRGMLDTDGLRHTAKVAWRALALLQKELEQESK